MFMEAGSYLGCCYSYNSLVKKLESIARLYIERSVRAQDEFFKSKR